MNSSHPPGTTRMREAEDLLAANWRACEALAVMRIQTLQAFETAWPAEEDVASISTEQRQAALANLATLLDAGSKAIQALVHQDRAIIAALYIQGSAVPDPAAASPTTTSDYHAKA